MYRATIYRDRLDLFRWRLTAQNGKVVADSGEGYERTMGAEKGLESALLILQDYGQGYRLGGGIEVYEDLAGRWRWRAVASNGRIVADCGGSYSRRSSVRRALDRLAAGCLSYVDVVIAIEAP